MSEGIDHKFQRQSLAIEILQRGGKLIALDGEHGFSQPQMYFNLNLNNQSSSVFNRPDVIAVDPMSGQFIIGEAKAGDGDEFTQHSLDQYVTFSRQPNSILIIALPIMKINGLINFLRQYEGFVDSSKTKVIGY